MIETIVPALRQALEKRGYEQLTEVQQAVTNPDIIGQDALVSAQTGSGKTVAFGLAMAPTILDDGEKFSRSSGVAALVVAPTRELALQVKRELEWLYEKTNARIASCVGGMDIRTERRELDRGANIVVGTPGRLTDHMRRGALDASDLKIVVLDEADEMLDLGFKDDLEFILEKSPEDRQTLLFSATVSRSIASLAKNYQRDAVRISTKEEKKQHSDIDYRAMSVAQGEQQNAIVNVLRYYEAQNALVFCNTRASVNHMVARLHNRGFSVVALSGELSQSERTHALQALRDGRARVCVATDVAARGLDLPNLELVIHAELPTNSEILLHRSGRTGRAGRKGVSALIVPAKQYRKAERLLGQGGIKATWAKPPSLEDVIGRDNERLMADPIFESETSDAETELGSDLLERYGAEKLAAAFVKLSRKGQSAPEDLAEITNPEPGRGGRDRGGRNERGERGERPMREPREPRRDFGPSVWYSLSVGRQQRAEPRWLIPIICDGGDISKKEIGSIKIQPTETFVEIAEANVAGFDAALGNNPKLDKNIKITRLAGKPKFAKFEGEDRLERPDRDRGTRGDRRAERPARSERHDGSERAERSDRGSRRDRSERDDTFVPNKKMVANAEVDRELETLFGGEDVRGEKGARGRGKPKSGARGKGPGGKGPKGAAGRGKPKGKTGGKPSPKKPYRTKPTR